MSLVLQDHPKRDVSFFPFVWASRTRATLPNRVQQSKPYPILQPRNRKSNVAQPFFYIAVANLTELPIELDFLFFYQHLLASMSSSGWISGKNYSHCVLNPKLLHAKCQANINISYRLVWLRTNVIMPNKKSGCANAFWLLCI